MIAGPSGSDGRSTLSALNAALDERDTVTNGHCDRVSGLSLELGRRCGLSEHDLRLLLSAARLHDIGKIGIPDTVLKKPGAFTPADWDVMKSHPAKGERIVLACDLEDSSSVALAVRHHHERFDGRGYPDELAGESIPIIARIIAVADTYDAMARLRAYGAPRTHNEIMAELHRVAGAQHDPFVTAKFAALIETSPFRTNGS